MEYNFSNGTVEQVSRWRQAVDHLINFPSLAFPLAIAVSFVDPSQVNDHGHTDLALTTWTYDSTNAATKVRNDAPSYGPQEAALRAEAAAQGLPYNPDIHYNETAVHELGHALYASLPEAARVAIAKMFGAKSDSLAELQPAGAQWKDQIIEGIAETFKEAFLPRRFRVFNNRTNRKLPYNKFPEFRRIIRDAVPEIGAETLAEQMWNLPIVDPLNDRREEPLGAPYVKWPPATSIGRINQPSWRYSNMFRLNHPEYSAAIREDTVFTEGRFGVSIGHGATPASTAPDAWYEVFAAATTTDGGSAYRLVAQRNGGGGSTWNARLELWRGGVLKSVLKEVEFSPSGIIQPLGLSVFDGVLTAWYFGGYDSTLPPSLFELFSVKDSTLIEGYVGIGVGYTYLVGGAPEEVIEEENLRAGPLVSGAGKPISVPKGLILPTGATSEAHPHIRPVSGSYG